MSNDFDALRVRVDEELARILKEMEQNPLPDPVEQEARMKGAREMARLAREKLRLMGPPT